MDLAVVVASEAEVEEEARAAEFLSLKHKNRNNQRR
jgi:hypothetical protein